MTLLTKFKNLFVEKKPTAHQISPRSARLISLEADGDDAEIQKRLKGWVKATLASAPWLAVAGVLFAVVSHGAIAVGALAYGVLKVSIAVLLTFVADTTMFRGLHQEGESGWQPMMRRAVVFMGICWLLAVA